MTVARLSGTLVWLTVLWVMLWGSLTIANVVSGVLVGMAILTFARLPRIARVAKDQAVRISPLALAWFVVFVLFKLVESTLLLAWEIVTPRNKINTGVIAVPLRTESEMVMLIVATVITLTPGTVTIEVAGRPPTIFVNVLHLHDLDQVRRDLLHLEALSIRAFGSSSARQLLAEETSR